MEYSFQSFYLCAMDKKESILQAALTLLVEQGIHATPVSQIAKKAGTGMGTIYNYFENKEVLINAIYVDIKQKEKAILDKSFQEEMPVKVQFEHYYRSTTEFFLKNPLYFLFMDQLHASPVITEHSRESGYLAIGPVVSLLHRGKEEYIIKNLPDNELLQFIGGSILSYLRWLGQIKEHADQKNSLHNQMRLVWDAIKA